MKEYNYMFTGNTLFISAEGNTWLLGESDADRRSKVLTLIKEEKPWSDIKTVLEVDKGEEMRKWCEEASIDGSGIAFNDTTILIDGTPIYGSLCSQIQLMHNEGLPLEPMVNFVRKMRKNPSYSIREQLWSFMEACQAEGGFTIAEDGDIMAYKVVTRDFKDKHTHTFDNSIGSIVEMPRCEVDDNPNNTCSAGLHFCAYSYVKCFSDIEDRLVLVKINPADVVSIPADYGNAKARCCRYRVVREIDAPVGRTVWKDEAKNSSNEENPKMHRLGDKIKALIDDYEFHDGSLEREVIGRIVVVDPHDECQPYKLRFFDGIEIVEWWISEKMITSFISGGDEIENSFKPGDACMIYGTCPGKIMDVDEDDNTYLVKYRDEDGNVLLVWMQAFDLDHAFVKKDSLEKEDESDDEMQVKLKKKLEELENLLKHELSKLTSNEDDESYEDDEEDEADEELKDMTSEEFVRHWLTFSPKKMVLIFLESQYDDIMDSRMRMQFMNDEIPVGIVVRKLMDWYYEEYDGNITQDRVWDKIRTTIEIWTNRS